MGKFILGMAVAVAILVLGVIGSALLGFLPVNANSPPGKMESQIMMSALDSSVERRAPRTNNPVPPTDENLIEGMKIYTMNCAGCHGGLDRQTAPLGNSLYPPPPNLITDPDDDPEWHIFYVIRNGVRYSGMPAWDKALSDADMWKVTAFVARIEKLSPAVQDYWKKSSGAASAAAPEEKEHHDHH